MEARTTPAKALSFGAVFQNYFRYAQSLRTCARMGWTYRQYLADMACRDALSISTDEIETIRRQLSDTISPKTANTVMELMPHCIQPSDRIRIDTGL